MFEEEKDWQEGDADDYKGQEGDPQAQGEGAVPPLKAPHRHVRHPIPPPPVRLQQSFTKFYKVSACLQWCAHLYTYIGKHAKVTLRCQATKASTAK